MKTLPEPNLESTVMSPPSALTSSRTSERPMPVPSNERALLSTRWKRSKMVSRSSSRMPTPLSSIEKTPSFELNRTLTTIVPATVYLKALLCADSRNERQRRKFVRNQEAGRTRAG